uniref:Phosphodiesterase n=1 Tax=Latimeria chalumnae TaxID=7897 RepID=H3A551_LATCH
DLFRAAAEAGPHDILKLYNTKGNIVNISPKLEPNTQQTRYKLEVVAADCNSEYLGSELAASLGFDLSTMEKRLQGLEKKILVEAGETPSIVYEMRNKVESFRQKLESVEHLSWLGLFKELTEVPHKPSPFYHKKTLQKTREECEHVLEKYLQMSFWMQKSYEKKKKKKDTWNQRRMEILEILKCFKIPFSLVLSFDTLLRYRKRYRRTSNVETKRFNLCFSIVQMYGLIWLTDLRSKIDEIDILTMLTSAICHDLDHTGYNNAYQINARTELALRYNDISPLENHHCAVAFEILEKPEHNIFRNLTTEQYKRIREGMIKCILATDMVRHNEILNQFKSIHHLRNRGGRDYNVILMMIMIKVSDISNEARPMDVAEPWLDCLLQEFFNQSDMEKLEGLPVSPFMDRDKVTKPSSQTGFIRFVLFPLFMELANLFPCLE